MTVQLRIEKHVDVVRQPCLACDGETGAHPVQAYCFDNDRRVGVICEQCLKEQEVGDLDVYGRIPTYDELEHRRQIEEKSSSRRRKAHGSQ